MTKMRSPGRILEPFESSTTCYAQSVRSSIIRFDLAPQAKAWTKPPEPSTADLYEMDALAARARFSARRTAASIATSDEQAVSIARQGPNRVRHASDGRGRRAGIIGARSAPTEVAFEDSPCTGLIRKVQLRVSLSYQEVTLVHRDTNGPKLASVKANDEGASIAQIQIASGLLVPTSNGVAATRIY